MIVALIALFVALGGAAYAKQSQQRQKVFSAQIITRMTVSETVQPGSSGDASSMCPRGYRAIGGGSFHFHDYVHETDFNTVYVGPVITGKSSSTSPPWWEYDLGGPQRLPAAKGWGAFMRNVGPTEGKFAVAAVCAKVVVDQ
jgi:hypothetical protein